MKNQKGFVLPVLIIISLLILTVIVYFFSPKSLSSVNVKLPTASPSSPDNSIADWRTYIDSQNRFSFRYPLIFSLESKVNQFFESEYLKFDDTTRLNFLFKNEKLEYQNFNLNYYNIHEYEKDNMKIKIATYVSQNSGFPESIYIDGYIYGEGKYSMFRLYTTNDQREKWEPVFDQILSTFKFIE